MPPAIRARSTCSTLDSAKGAEAEHVRLVFVPRHAKDGVYNLGGLQKDPNRFYQGAMRPTQTLKIYVPEEALALHRVKRQPGPPLALQSDRPNPKA